MLSALNHAVSDRMVIAQFLSALTSEDDTEVRALRSRETTTRVENRKSCTRKIRRTIRRQEHRRSTRRTRLLGFARGDGTPVAPAVTAAVERAAKTPAVEIPATELTLTVKARLKRKKEMVPALIGVSDKLKTFFECHQHGRIQSRCPDRKCSLCGKLGHRPGSRARVQAALATADSNEDLCAKTSPLEERSMADWQPGDEKRISDSWAASHMTPSDESMYNFRRCNETMTVASGHSLAVEGYGSLKSVLRSQEREVNISQSNVAYVPALRYNLFSWKEADEKIIVT